MALAVTHAFVTAKTNGTDTSLLRPSNWNDNHVITMDTNTLMGKASVGTGPAEAIPVSAATIALLAAVDIPSILAYLGISPPTTGDGKISFKTVPDPGWLAMNDGTFGDASSGASNRTNPDTAALFTLFYNNVLDADAPLLTSAGAATTRAAQGSAATAFAAHCRMSLPKQLGRSITGAGTGAGLSARALGTALGLETTALITANLPPYTPSGGISNGLIDIANNQSIANGTAGSGITFYGPFANQGITHSNPTQAASSFGGNAQGGTSQPFNIVHPSTYWNVMVKL